MASIDDKVIDGESIAYTAGGAAVGVGLDLVGIVDKLAERFYDATNLVVTQYDALAPSFYNSANYFGFDLGFFGAAFSAMANKPKGILYSWLASGAYLLGSAALDYGAGYSVGSLGSVLAASVVASGGYVGLGLAAGYLLRAAWKGLKSIFKRG